jgi:hypothetical protein
VPGAWLLRSGEKGPDQASAAGTTREQTGTRRSAGRTWIHAALVAPARFRIDLRIGPRTLEMAVALGASVATCGTPFASLVLLADDHRPDPQAILTIFGITRHRRRRHGRGRMKHADLKPPPGLLVGIVSKLRDATGNLVRVRRRRLFGRLKDIRQRVKQLGLGSQINTAHIERINGTMRTQQTRLARRTRNVSRSDTWLERALSLWRDGYHWVGPHAPLAGRTPAMAMGLSDRLWTVPEYVGYPVHLGEFQRAIWAEDRENLLTTGLNRQKRLNPLPTS